MKTKRELVPSNYSNTLDRGSVYTYENMEMTNNESRNLSSSSSLFERGSTYVKFEDDPKLRSEVKMMHSKLFLLAIMKP